MTDAYSAPQSDLVERNSNLGAITEGMVSALRGTKTWVLLIGILIFILAAFMVLAGLLMMVGGAAMGQSVPGMPQGVFASLGLFYLVMAILYIVPALYLVRYSSAIGRLVSGGQPADMEAALDQQRKFWKFVGVLALIGIVLFIVMLVLAIAMPMLLMGMGARG